MSNIDELNKHYQNGYNAGELGHAYNIDAGMTKFDKDHYKAGFDAARTKKLGDKIRIMLNKERTQK